MFDTTEKVISLKSEGKYDATDTNHNKIWDLMLLKFCPVFQWLLLFQLFKSESLEWSIGIWDGYPEDY